MTRPKLVSPVDHASEAEVLLESGADELYGGVVPPAWEKRFGLLGSLNQRTFAQAQLQGFDELETVVRAAHARHKRFSLTLNAPFYSNDQHELIDEIVATASEIGIDGLILADPGLLRRLKSTYPHIEYHVSTLAHAGNVPSLTYFQQLGATRAGIPRHIDTRSIAQLAAELPQMRLDAFVIVGKCPNTEGLCTFHHAREDRIWPCEIPYTIRALEDPPGDALHHAILRQSSWSQSNRRHGCGLCALPALLKAGIYGLKLVGRGAPTSMKQANLKLILDFIAMAQSGMAGEEFRCAARTAHHQRFGSPCRANVCYYPKFCQGD